MSTPPLEAHREEVKAWLAGMSDLPAVFGRLDVNGDGFVSRPEMETFAFLSSLESLTDGALSKVVCNAMIYMGDEDGDESHRPG